MYCSDCEFLNDSKKKEGTINGCMYHCKKLDKMVPGNFSCDKFSKSYSRKYYDKQRIYTEGRKFSDKGKDNSGFIAIVLIILIILGIIFNVFN